MTFTSGGADMVGNGLLREADAGNLDSLKELLREAPDVDSRDADGSTALMEAAFSARSEIVEFLLQCGADVNARDKEGSCALLRACVQGSLEVMSLLLAAGAELNAGDLYGTTPLMEAAFWGNASSVELLLERGADVSVADRRGKTALHWAAVQGHGDVVGRLLATGSDADAQDHDGNTPVDWASFEGHRDVMRLLTTKATGNGFDGRDLDRELLSARAPGMHATVRKSLRSRTFCDTVSSWTTLLPAGLPVTPLPIGVTLVSLWDAEDSPRVVGLSRETREETMGCAAPNSMHWDDLRSRAGDEVLRREGVQASPDGSAYDVQFLNAVYRVDPCAERIAELSPEPGRVLSELFQILLIRYLVAPYGGPLAGRDVSEKDLPGGVTFFQGPHALYVGPIVELYGGDPEAFEIRGRQLGAEPAAYGDKALRFLPFPLMPVTYVLWRADDEFPSSVSVMFDASIVRWFELDMVFSVVYVLTERIIEGASS
jgi:ankyrin repeat protein